MKMEAQSSLRTPRSAAVAGIVFSVLLIAAFVLLNLSLQGDAVGTGRSLSDPGRRTGIVIALNLVPFAGIAFLWFIGVVRDRIGDREDRFFATVFLGSGLLFVGMLFVAAAVAGGLIADIVLRPATAILPEPLTVTREVTGLLLHVYAMRMAGVFTISTATITMRTQVIPRWIAFVGYGAALVMLVSIGLTPWVELLFPAWILLLSIEILRVSLRATEGIGEVP
jgi:hypothetical protein